MTKLNVLPENPDQKNAMGRFPKWLHRTLPQGLQGEALWQTHDILNEKRMPTVCEEAKCPNLPECYGKKTATFLAMGKECTRACGFCDIDFSKNPKTLEEDEPERLAHSAKLLGLKHVVITMVARDDLADGGAAHLKKIIEKTREVNPEITVEVLTSDFEGNTNSYDIIIESAPEIFNHNIETVRELTPRIRHKATYDRTLATLSYIHKHKKTNIFVKSGVMLGLGETEEQVHETLRDLASAGCDIVTIGQYLQPNRHKLRVQTFVHPDQFEKYAQIGRSLGIKHIYAGPFVRSSYNAAALYELIQSKR